MATINDLLADPLPSVALEDLGAFDPHNWKMLTDLPYWTYDQPYPNLPGNSPPVRAWLCQSPLPMMKEAVRLGVREAHCLELVASQWVSYVRRGDSKKFERARMAYAFAAATLGPAGRAFLDEVIRERMPEPGALATPAPTPPSVRKGSDLLSERLTKVDPADIATVVRDAIAEDPTAALDLNLAMPIKVGRQMVQDQGPYPKGIELDTALEVCAYGHRGAFRTERYPDGKSYDLDMQDGCLMIVVQFWKIYQRSGAQSAYDTAVFAYRLGVQGAPPCRKLGIMGHGCPEEWIDLLRMRLGPRP